MITKLSSVSFKEEGDKGKYAVKLDDDSIFNFTPYSSLDGIAAAEIEYTIQKKINENNPEIEEEDFNSPSTIHRQEIFIPSKQEYQFKITKTLTMNDSYSFSNKISLRNNEKKTGLDYNVLLGQFYNQDKYFVQEFKKVFGEHGNISANINTWAFCRNDISMSKEEKMLVKHHFENNISQVLSTTPQELARKPA